MLHEYFRSCPETSNPDKGRADSGAMDGGPKAWRHRGRLSSLTAWAGGIRVRGGGGGCWWCPVASDTEGWDGRRREWTAWGDGLCK